MSGSSRATRRVHSVDAAIASDGALVPGEDGLRAVDEPAGLPQRERLGQPVLGAELGVQGLPAGARCLGDVGHPCGRPARRHRRVVRRVEQRLAE